MSNEDQENISAEELVKDFQARIIDLLKYTVSDENKRVLPEFEKFFVGVSKDAAGIEYIQTLAGMLTFAEGGVQYSPCLSADSVQLAIEVSNITRFSLQCGVIITVVGAHFVSLTGKFWVGPEAYQAKISEDDIATLKRLKERKEQSAKPSIILPNDGKIALS
ncbi:hypothetical protein G646_gp137 [Serratia phage phiMAM1]|uniref:Uncharacterized protein n=1 Tax=Serratia phage phiMAM1 TaxID=1262513 RepID=K7YY28_9CAUD|nr:hypothetical protein G646_gp137 [Serratia phage phiMAM1]AFX93605.1 hypothetical protein MAM_137 [Serratia phage phiMAM1]